LSKDGRHISFTSKDIELVVAFKQCLGLSNTIGRGARGGETEKRYLRIQFGSRTFYDFLLSIGLMPAKSKILGPLRVPSKHFADFLRGCLDGDGHINVSRHPESQHLQLRLRLTSASLAFLIWIRHEIAACWGIRRGWIWTGPRAYALHYGKADSIRIFRMIYYEGVWPFLGRKWAMAERFMRA